MGHKKKKRKRQYRGSMGSIYFNCVTKVQGKWPTALPDGAPTSRSDYKGGKGADHNMQGSGGPHTSVLLVVTSTHMVNYT